MPSEMVRTTRQTVAKNTFVFSTARRRKNHSDVCKHLRDDIAIGEFMQLQTRDLLSKSNRTAEMLWVHQAAAWMLAASPPVAAALVAGIRHDLWRRHSSMHAGSCGWRLLTQRSPLHSRTLDSFRLTSATRAMKARDSTTQMPISARFIWRSRMNSSRSTTSLPTCLHKLPFVWPQCR